MHPSPDLVLLDLDGTLSEAGPATTAAVAVYRASYDLLGSPYTPGCSRP